MKSIYPIAAYIAIVAVFFFLLVAYSPSSTPKDLETSVATEQPESKEPVIRLPQVAGQFYSSDAKTLQTQISSFLEKAKKTDINNISILIAPHAGYVYSGGVAAYSYKQLVGGEYDTVIVIGPSHYKSFDGISIFNGDYYETPLGKVKVDRELANLLINESKKIKYFADAEKQEHSVEVHVPFLQAVLKDFKIVPIIMGSQSPENAEILAGAISKYADDKTLIVASTDLSHYHGYEEAQRMDNIALRYVETRDVFGLYSAASSGKCEMCGLGPVVVAMFTAEKLGKTKSQILAYANSGDVTRDESRVVGYGAVAMYGDTMFSGRDRTELLHIARESIENYVRYRKVSTFTVTNPRLIEKGATFVTITEGGQLRGCIGTTVAMQPLYLAVRDAAISAAVRDPRFMPLSIAELGKIDLEISVLSQPKEITNVTEIEVGRHGLIIAKGGNSGLLLPQVATDYGWDRYIFLDETCRKAGLDAGCWREGARILTFEAEVFWE